jgi:preprotein translocase subunit SecD
MNRYPLWKYLLIVAVIIPGLLYALPNIYGEDPAVQIAGTGLNNVDQATLKQVEQALQEQGINATRAILDSSGIKLRFADAETQLKAKDVVQDELKDGYTVALNLLPSTPNWLSSIGGAPMYLGLDLRGGVHFLMEVDIAGAVISAEQRYVGDLRTILREAKVRYLTIRRAAEGGVEVKFRDQGRRDEGRQAIFDELTQLNLTDIEREGKPALLATLSEDAVAEIKSFALQQNMTSLRNRVDELGVAEPVVQQQGDRRIVVQLPGVQDTAKAKEILGKTATLEIRLVDEEHDLQSALRGSVPAGSRLYRMRNGGQILLKKRLIYSGHNIVDAAASRDQLTGTAVVSITLDSRGAEINQRVTGENVGKRMAVVFVEDRSETRLNEDGLPVVNAQGDVEKVRKRIEEVITAPVIREQLGKRFQIEGLDSSEEAQDLALLLRAGALAAPIEIIEERTVGPSLGRDNINKGFRSVLIGFLLVLAFMFFYYRIFGAVACAALMMNLVLLVAVLSLLQATLTLPGVAGIVLTVGMAVDANVLIFERIREEIRNGNSPQASIHVGYNKAFGTILDANVTTLIASIVLFSIGSGPVKGFAVTLSIGILTSMFTAIWGTRALINLIYGGRRVSKLAI